MKTKICSKCKEEKTIDSFYKSGKHLQSWCKDCIKILNDSRKEYKSKWHLDNRERILKSNNEKYRELHPIEDIKEEYKRCCKCNEVKLKKEFGKSSKSKDRLRYSCNNCRTKEYINNQEHNIERSKKNYINNKEYISIRNKEYKEKRKEYYQEYDKKYYKNNAEKIKSNVKKNFYKRIENDIGFKILQRCRARLYKAIKGSVKSDRTKKLIGCSVEKLLSHIASQFEEGMTWENYGEWHIDHIKPCKLFNFEKEEDQRECFNYINLQPLWASDNMAKSAKY